MPVVQTVSFKHGDNDFCLEGKYSVSVDKEGQFSAVLPEHVVEAMEAVGIHMASNNRSKRKGWFSDSTLEGLKKKMSDAMEAYFKKEIIFKGFVLQYQIATTCDYMIDEETLEFIPNGAFRTSKDMNYKWLGGTVKRDAMVDRPYGLQVFVRPACKTVIKFLTGEEKAVYDLDSGSLPNDRDDLHWLRALRVGPLREGLAVQEVPATPENCLFFINLMKSIFSLNQKIKELTGPEAIQYLAARGCKFSLLGGSDV